MEGIRATIGARDRADLEQALRVLFAPIAPTVRVIHGDRSPVDGGHVGAAADYVAWQHIGFGDSALASEYRSKRTNRALLAQVSGMPIAAVSQTIDASGLRGASVRFRGKARNARHGQAELWIRVDTPRGEGFFDNMLDRPITSEQWTDIEVSGPVTQDATRIVFGIVKVDSGVSWFDDLHLEAKAANGDWRPIPIADPDFESANPLAAWHPGNAGGITSSEGWLVVQDRTEAASGKASLRVEPHLITLTDNLFSAVPEPGEVYALDLGQGLRAQVPISLTEAVASSPVPRPQLTVTNSQAATSFDSFAGIADVIVLWNALEHFWPYWDLVAVNWGDVLDASLVRALGDKDGEAHQRTMERLSAELPDGHAGIECQYVQPSTTPAFNLELIGDRVVVTDSDIPDLRVGDEVLDIDTHRAIELVREQTYFVSGSPQWRTIQALQRLGMGVPGTAVALHVRRDDGDHTISARRAPAGVSLHRRYRYKAISRFDDGVYYVDLSRIQTSDLDEIEAKLATAPGIVFDMRERPIESRPLLSHLLTEDIVATQFFLPQIIRPDHRATSLAEWRPSSWKIAATRPHFNARIAFVADAATLSLPESYLGLVAHYHLGEIVGGPTAGTDGDRTELVGPSGCVTSFTGVRTTNFDGSRFHLIGVRPTIPAARTVAGIRSGRDELLEKALTYVRTGAR